MKATIIKIARNAAAALVVCLLAGCQTAEQARAYWADVPESSLYAMLDMTRPECVGMKELQRRVGSPAVCPSPYVDILACNEAWRCDAERGHWAHIQSAARAELERRTTPQ